MAEFSFLAFYKDHHIPSDKHDMQKDNSSFAYSKHQTRQRFQSLTPVMEHDMPEEHKQSKRRFSLDYFLSKKKKEFKLPKDKRRNTTASSTSSIDSDLNSNPNSKPGSRKASTDSVKVSKAEIAAWIFS